MSSFKAASIPKYSVICLPIKFGESEHRLSKQFVVLCHQGGYAVCLKATSKVEIYINNKEQMGGCVFYKRGETTIFKQDTAIQPDNQIPISHLEIETNHTRNSLDILGVLPVAFERQLIQAIRNSVTLSDRERKRLFLVLNIIP